MKEYWLNEGIIIELVPNKEITIIVPSNRKKLKIGKGVLSLILNIYESNLSGEGFTITSNKNLIDQLITEKIIFPYKVNYKNTSFHFSMLTLSEFATMKLTELGGCFTSNLNHNHKLTTINKRFELDEPFIQLSQTETPNNKNLWEAFRLRRSNRNGILRSISLQKLSMILQYSAKIDYFKEDAFGQVSFRPTASGGAKHPIDIFLILYRIDKLKDGLYYYNPLYHCLKHIDIEINLLNNLVKSSFSSTNRKIEILPAINILFIATPSITACKYHYSALSTIYKDVGCLIQQLSLVTEGIDLTGSTFSVIDISLLNEVIELNKKSFVGGYWIW